MTNEVNLSTSEIIGIAQVYATLALTSATLSTSLTFVQGKEQYIADAKVAWAKARMVVMQAEDRGLSREDAGVGPNTSVRVNREII